MYQGKSFVYDSLQRTFDGLDTEIESIIVDPSTEIRTFNWGGYTWLNRKVIQRNNIQAVSDTIIQAFDEYGNETTREVRSNGEGSYSVSRTFTNAGSWCPSQVSAVTSTKRKTGSPGNFSEASDFTYNTLGFLDTERHFINTSSLLTVEYEYDGFGNITRKTQLSAGTPSRSEAYTYDSRNRLPVTINRGILQIEKTYDFSSGNLLTEKDPGSNIITYSYDSDDRINRISRSSTQYSEISYLWNTSEPAQALIMTEAKVNGGNTVKTWYDGAGRVLRESMKAFGGEEVITDKTYNQWGLSNKSSQPYFSGGTPGWNYFDYDTIGRLNHTLLNGSSSSISYNNLTTTISKFFLGDDRVSELRERSVTQNGLGQVITVGQNDLTMSFVYDDKGSVQTVTPPSTGTQLSFTYDTRGLPLSQTDPDMGINQTSFNGFGEQVTFTNAAGQPSTNHYDIIGRDSIRIRPEGNTTFTYITSGPAKGNVSQITTPDEVRKYGYNSMGRVSRVCDSINANEKMDFSYEYDSYGRVSKLTYPTGYYITWHYNSNGYLSQIKDGNTSSVIWQCNTVDRWGNTTGASLSNGTITTTRSYDNNGQITEIKTTSGGTPKQWFGYSFNAHTGNLSWRRDSIRQLTERFRYDLFDRLVSAKGTGIDSLIMTYDNTGNIISKTDAGDYSYHSQKVHAVESIEPVEPLSVFGDQRISYNYMNLPIYIANDEDSLVYTYGVGNKRIKARQYSGGQLVSTTWYGDNFERVVEGSTENFYHWIQSPDGPVALVIKVTGGATTIYYLCTDHLSSITGIMDASGNMQEEYSYDPWGRRRSPVNWSTNSLTAPVITTRGYTGHEHLDAFGLIHMNGRIYDPHLARVLNPDPIIQDPTDIQNYNRYSYCLNNPLKYTDPSGFMNFPEALNYLWNHTEHGGYWQQGGVPVPFRHEDVNYILSAFRIGAGGGGGSRSGSVDLYVDNFMSDDFGGIAFNLSNRYGTDWYFAANETLGLTYSVEFSRTVTTPSGIPSGDGGYNLLDGAGFLATISSIGHSVRAYDTYNEHGWKNSSGRQYSSDLLKKGSNGKYVRGVQGYRNSANLAKSTSQTLKATGKAFGLIGVGVTIADGFSDGYLSWGDGAKIGIGLITTFTPVGWGYGLIDFGTYIVTGTSLTDRAGNYIDSL